MYVRHAGAVHAWKRYEQCGRYLADKTLWLGCDISENLTIYNSRIRVTSNKFSYEPLGGLSASKPLTGWSNIVIPGNFIFVIHVIAV